MNTQFLNQHRLTHGICRSGPEDGFNGAFEFEVLGRPVRCIVSDGEGWQHVSVSQVGSSKPPSWDVMCVIKDLFWEAEDCVVQYHPPASRYVNNHPGCLHLWRPTSQSIPQPPDEMVGIKRAGQNLNPRAAAAMYLAANLAYHP